MLTQPQQASTAEPVLGTFNYILSGVSEYSGNLLIINNTIFRGKALNFGVLKQSV